MDWLDPLGAKCRDIRPLLKEIDKDFEIVFNYKTEKYEIMHNGMLFQTVPFGQFDRKLLADIKHTVWLNRTRQLLDYIDKQNERVEASEDRKLSNYAEALAKDLRRPLINNYYYGV